MVGKMYGELDSSESISGGLVGRDLVIDLQVYSNTQIRMFLNKIKFSIYLFFPDLILSWGKVMILNSQMFILGI
jgi:hypothetical protein